MIFILPLATSTILPAENSKGGFDARGVWVERVESGIHNEWWLDWSRDINLNSVDDRLEWILEQPTEIQNDWWRRAPEGSSRLFVNYDHHPTDYDVKAVEEIDGEVTFRPKYLDNLIITIPTEQITSQTGLLSLNGVVMIEDLGLAEPNMHEAVPNMGVNSVWDDLGLDGTGSTIAILDTGVRGDHEGLNDMDDDPFTCIDEPPNPMDPNPQPISDCDPKIVAFYDAVFTDEEQDPATSYDSGTHGSHVAGIAAGTGGGQTDTATGLEYIGAAPGAFLVTILACCDGDIEDIIQGAEWTIENKERHSIDILTSSLGEQQIENHIDNDGSSSWSRQMDYVVEAGIITTLSAGNEFGGATFAGCNTIDSPGDAELPVTVGSLDKDLGLAIYSSRGYTSDLRVKPDVAVIGSNIMAPDAATSDGYTSKSGTSMATPLMAGIAALMIQANPDLTPEEFKDIIRVDSIERDIALLDDPGFNDCSILETRPDNEFGYGQADPVAFVESAGNIDRSLNVSMNLETLQTINNESYVSGVSSGAVPGQEGEVQVRVGSGDWKGAADIGGNSDWSEWRVKLLPHEKSGNSTIYARLIISDDRVSPVDAKRVLLVDQVASNMGEEGDLISIGSQIFFIPFLIALGILAYAAVNERWIDKLEKTHEKTKKERFNLNKYNPRRLPKIMRNIVKEWNNGASLNENQFRRLVSLCVLYLAQGLPAGFTYVAFVAYLSDNGTPPQEIAILFATIALPWTFKFVWGPVIDLLVIPEYGRRRPWILFAQSGMVLSLATILFVPNIIDRIALVTVLLFVHNLFSSLQDVSVDALAVDVLQPDEVAKANGMMFATKRGGMILGGAVLGMLVPTFGIKFVIMIQIPLLILIMLLPLFLREKPGNKLFPWENLENVIGNDEEEILVSDEGSSLAWKEDSDSRFRGARWTASNIYKNRISVSAAFLWIGLAIWIFGSAVDIMYLIGEPLIGGIVEEIFVKLSIVSTLGIYLIIASIIMIIIEGFGINLPEIVSPLAFSPSSAKRSIANTAYYIVQGFSTRSSFLLIFLCLLSDLALFVDPIIVDIFINEAGWSQQKYNAIIGGIVVLFTMLGQIFGGFLGDKYGVREIAMIGFTLLALANAGLALLNSYWEDTTIMTIYLCVKALIYGIAWICVISVSMRLTFSKAGGTQFTAYMSMFNLSAVFAYLFSGKMIARFDYLTMLYIGAALTLISVIMLLFIDPDETDRVLESRFGDDDSGGDLGENLWLEDGQSKDAILIGGTENVTA
jgi:subtilisin family serine protease/MFS family permease